MSGRDLRSFVTLHREDEAALERLKCRLRGGLASSKYKNVDYDSLKALAAEKRFAGQETLVKVKKLQDTAKQSRELNLVQEHVKVWQSEFLRLNSARKRLEAEIGSHMRQNTNHEATEQIYGDLDNYANRLDQGFLQFKTATVDPIWSLRDDLQFCLRQNRTGVQEQNAEEIVATIDSVKCQQDKILTRLQHEEQALSENLASEFSFVTSKQDRSKVQTGIPEAAFDLECPDLDLKANVLQEFILLDERFVEKLDSLESEYECLHSCNTGKLNDDDRFMFRYVIDQYPFDLPQRRTLYMDRLRRHLPHKTRAELVEHEEFVSMCRYHDERVHSLMCDWQRDRRELLDRVTAAFTEACEQRDETMKRDDDRARQRQMCDMLCAQVREWRKSKQELSELEAAEREREAEEKRELEKWEEEQRQQRRNSDREKIKLYRERKARQRKQEEEENRRRMKELKQRLAEQAKYDLERINFRKQELQKREEANRLAEEKKKHEDEERERRLEATRQMVRPVVESDPARVCNETEAWKSRLKDNVDDVNIQQPLFDVNSFTVAQITTDPRFRLDEKLREAGLHTSEFARKAMASVKPPHPPRPDMESSLFK